MGKRQNQALFSKYSGCWKIKIEHLKIFSENSQYLNPNFQSRSFLSLLFSLPWFCHSKRPPADTLLNSFFCLVSGWSPGPGLQPAPPCSRVWMWGLNHAVFDIGWVQQLELLSVSLVIRPFVPLSPASMSPLNLPLKWHWGWVKPLHLSLQSQRGSQNDVLPR